MLITKLVVEKFAEGVIEGIQRNIREKPITEFGAANNTGEAARSLRYKFDGKRLVIYSTWRFFWVLETGRKPGKRPPIEPILHWLETKPVRASDISERSLAFLIARKIGAEGSLLYRQGGNSGIISDFTNDAYIRQNLTDKLRDRLVEQTIELISKSAA